MDEKELREILKLLEDAGMDPQLCDTLLPHYLGKANCGVPLETSGDVDDMIPIPKALLSWGLQYFVSAQGDSMKDVGIEDGDRLRVDVSKPIRDGDVVVAYLDREITVKTLMSDEEGDRCRSWSITFAKLQNFFHTTKRPQGLRRKLFGCSVVFDVLQ